MWNRWHFGRKESLLLIFTFLLVFIILLIVFAGVDGTTAAGGFLLTIGGVFTNKLGSAFDYEFGSSRKPEPPKATP